MALQSFPKQGFGPSASVQYRELVKKVDSSGHRRLTQCNFGKKPSEFYVQLSMRMTVLGVQIWPENLEYKVWL